MEAVVTHPGITMTRLRTSPPRTGRRVFDGNLQTIAVRSFLVDVVLGRVMDIHRYMKVTRIGCSTPRLTIISSVQSLKGERDWMESLQIRVLACPAEL